MLLAFYRSSVGKKIVMAITGAILALFVLMHLLGNLLIFASNPLFNEYAHKLTSSPFLYLAEIFLGLIFLIHITTASLLTYESWKARPVKYAYKKNKEESTWASRTMPYTGLLILVGILAHLTHFKFGSVYTDPNLLAVRDLKRTVIEFYASSSHVIGYIVAMMIVALHLSHGSYSLFQTFGLNNDHTKKKIKRLAFLFSVAIFLFYSAIPVITYFCLQYK